MQRESSIPTAHAGSRAVLFLQGSEAGSITVQGWDASWTYGRFEPRDGFGPFATLFGRWSLLMHEDEHQPADAQIREELRQAEQQMDRVRARVYFPGEGAWHDVAQLNIDGELIEWKEV